MNNAKKYICFLVLGCVLCTHVYNVYQTCYASELVVAGGLASGGTALLGLLALSGVGMELENNRKFNELTDEEKLRIENGLVQDYEEVALQRGASLEKIKNWTNQLQQGVLDKANECWGIFKDWSKNIDLTTSSENNPADNFPVGAIPASIVFPLTITNNAGNTTTLNYDGATKAFFDNATYNGSLVYATFNPSGTHNGYLQINVVNRADNGYRVKNYSTYYYGSNGTIGGWSQRNPTTVSDIIINDTLLKSYGNDDIMITVNGVTQSGNYIDSSENVVSYFKTNTDYLERLKGQEEDVIDVIDVTDIKHPIVESAGNNIANIDWNRGTNRNNNNDDDDNEFSTALVPADVWYEAIDDEQEGMSNAVIEYNNYIEEHPEEQGKYFVSTTPITNIHNYYNTLPVVNIPAPGTVVNNYYEYNNYNNHNVTIYQDPYNAGIIPTFPDFSKKFPFCIPFDLYEFFAVFLAEKEAPKIDIPFPVLDNTQHQLSVEYITIDLAPYEYVSDVLRVMLFIAFCVGLMLITRHLIKG